MRARWQAACSSWSRRSLRRAVLNDDKAAYFASLWKEAGADELVDKVLADTSLWDTDLSGLNGFASAVKENLHALINKGALSTLAQFGKIKSVL